MDPIVVSILLYKYFLIKYSRLTVVPNIWAESRLSSNYDLLFYFLTLYKVSPTPFVKYIFVVRNSSVLMNFSVCFLCWCAGVLVCWVQEYQWSLLVQRRTLSWDHLLSSQVNTLDCPPSPQIRSLGTGCLFPCKPITLFTRNSQSHRNYDWMWNKLSNFLVDIGHTVQSKFHNQEISTIQLKFSMFQGCFPL